MPRYRVHFTTSISLAVELDAEDENEAAEAAWQPTEDYLQTLRGDGYRVVSVDATLDGIGGDEVEEIEPAKVDR
jgi:hypothetical protein